MFDSEEPSKEILRDSYSITTIWENNVLSEFGEHNYALIFHRSWIKASDI